jgi:sporulation-control protein
MSFMGRLLSSIGVGAAKVDTKLEKEEFVPGEEVRGVVEISGGNAAQQIEGIRIEIQTYYKRESGDNTVTETGTIGATPVASAMNIEPNSEERIPFSCRLPYETPLTLGRASVWVRTALDVRGALDPSDSDSITVKPNATMKAVLDGLERLGFERRNVENEELPHRLRRKLSFGQEFEFRARSGEFGGKLDELELVMFPAEGSVDVLLQVDRRARDLGSMFSEALGTDESYARLTVSDADAGRGADYVSGMLAREIRARA